MPDEGPELCKIAKVRCQLYSLVRAEQVEAAVGMSPGRGVVAVEAGARQRPPGAVQRGGQVHVATLKIAVIFKYSEKNYKCTLSSPNNVFREILSTPLLLVVSTLAMSPRSGSWLVQMSPPSRGPAPAPMCRRAQEAGPSCSRAGLCAQVGRAVSSQV